MRTDHVTAWLIKLWLDNNAPDTIDHWVLDVDPQVKGFVDKLKSLIPDAEAQSIGQHVLAKATIELWNLRDVALLGGGTPTPFSPRPDQLRYFTDAGAEAVAEAQAAGYTARRVNVTSLSDLQQLEGAVTAVATGLFHFLPDAALQGVLQLLATTGFQTVVFNHANPGFSAEVIDQYSKLGIVVRFRTSEQIQALLPEHWSIDLVVGAPKIMSHADGIGQHLGKLPALFDVYRVTKMS